LTTTSSAPSVNTQYLHVPSLRHVHLWMAFLFLLLSVVYLGSAFSPTLQDDADSTHAEAAREMFLSGDYVTLHVNGVRYLEKAPLPYWLVAFGFRVFGVNEFATRLPNVVAIFLLAWLAVRWGTRAFDERTGIYAGLFVCTSAGFYLFTRILIPEAILSLFIAASLYFFLTALQPRVRSWRWYGGYTCLALAVLTKGLIPLIFVGITAMAYAAITGTWRRWREFRLGTGLLLFFAVAAPWHILAGVRNQHFFWFYFVNEHFLRFLGKRYPVDYNKVPALLYWSLHLVWLFPWSLYLPVALRDLVANRRGLIHAHDFRTQTRLLCWLWSGVILLFFAFSTSQEYYTFPAYFPLTLMLADAVAHEEQKNPRSRWLLGLSAAIATICLIAAGTLVAGLWQSRSLPFVNDIGTVLAKHDMAEDTLSMSHMLDLTGHSFAALRLPAIVAVLAWTIFPIAMLVLRMRRKQVAATVSMTLSMALFLVAAHIALVRFGPYLGSQELAAVIQKHMKTSARIMIYGDQAFGSSLLFYTGHRIYLVNGRTTSMWFGSTYPDAPHIFLDDADLLRDWNSSRGIFLFVPQYERSRVDSLLPPGKFVVGESSGKIVYSNRP
jgi:4-amino-4-deoxy-L-arabinose transferase-like glycosyltransferase